MSMSSERHEDSTGPGATGWLSPPPMSSRGRGRRVLGVLGFVAAGMVEMFHIAVAVMMGWSIEEERVGLLYAPVNLQLLALAIGFTACLYGSAVGLRVARVCAAVFFALVLVEVIVGLVLGVRGVPDPMIAVISAIPGFILIAGIVAMTPERSSTV